MRIDKWLWFTRFFKTRVLAAKAVAGGHVRVNGVRARASTRVSRGDVVILVRDQLTFNLKVADLPARRGPAVEAQCCYTEDERSVVSRQQMVDEIRADRRQMPTTPGKPDKRTRRKLMQKSRGTS